MAKPKVAVQVSDLEKHMLEQLGFLRRSIRDYDAGEMSEFKRMATTIRVLVHDTSSSHSLLSQLNIKDFIGSYSYIPDPNNLLTQFCVGGMAMSDSGVAYFPLLQSMPRRELTFDNWWTETIIVDSDKDEISRKSLVLAVANKDGGAHIDNQLDGVYHALAKLNSLGWTAASNGIESNMENAEKVALRHIAFEVVDAIERGFLANLGKRGCWCGSGRLSRYCHLKEAISKNGQTASVPGLPPAMLSPPMH